MHYTKQTSTLLLSLGVLLVIPACGPKYQSKQLKPLNTQSAQFEQTKNNVTMRVKQLNQQEANAQFNGRASKLFMRKYSIVPLQVTITNAGTDEILFNKSALDLDLCNEREVAELLYTNAQSRVIGIRALCGAGFGVSCIGIYPALWIAALGIPFGVPLLMSLCGAAIYSGYAFMTADNQYETCADVNDVIDKDISAKTLKVNAATIKPGKELNYLLFANGKTFKPNFTLTLSDSDNKKLAFDVDLRYKKSEYLY
jgi:hypothetical protein